MANSEAGARIGGAGRQREYIEGENWEKGQSSSPRRRRTLGASHPATQQTRSKSKI